MILCFQHFKQLYLFMYCICLFVFILFMYYLYYKNWSSMYLHTIQRCWRMLPGLSFLNLIRGSHSNKVSLFAWYPSSMAFLINALLITCLINGCTCSIMRTDLVARSSQGSAGGDSFRECGLKSCYTHQQNFPSCCSMVMLPLCCDAQIYSVYY